MATVSFAHVIGILIGIITLPISIAVSYAIVKDSKAHKDKDKSNKIILGISTGVIVSTGIGALITVILRAFV